MKQANYFQGLSNVSEIKKMYKTKLFELHPDRHDQSEFEKWNRLTQLLNEQYHEALKGQHKTKYVGTDNETHTYYYNKARESAVAAKVEELLKAQLSDHIDILVIGTWVWVVGTRYEDKEDRAKLKEASLRWHSGRKCWYYKTTNYKSSYNKSASLSDLRNYYGGGKVQREEEEEDEREALA